MVSCKRIISNNCSNNLINLTFNRKDCWYYEAIKMLLMANYFYVLQNQHHSYIMFKVEEPAYCKLIMGLGVYWLLH